MSRTVRFVAAALVLATLTCGSLGALPLRLSIVPAEPGESFLAAVVEWMASILAPDRPAGTASQRSQPKDAGTLDPSGGGNGGGNGGGG